MTRFSPSPRAIPLVLSALLTALARAQTPAATLPAGTPLPLRIAAALPLKTGQPVRAELIYPVYADNRLLLPAGTPVLGTVASLHSNRTRRVQAVLGGDFTPFRTPVVQFTSILLPDGVAVPLSTQPAAEGAPIFRAVAPPPSHGGLVRRQLHSGLTVARDNLALFLSPGKGARLLQFVYSQLPYHPQRIEPGTAWTVETSAPLTIPAQPAPPPPLPEPTRNRHFWEPEPAAPPPPNTDSSTWIVEAYLTEPLSSQTSVTGTPIHATVAQPVLAPDGSVAVPQGAVLLGSVTRAKPSRRFGRTGVLSFNFRQLVLPGSDDKQTVETRLTGADSAANVALNAEGQAKAKPQNKIAVPLILALMASQPLDQRERGQPAGNQAGRNAVGGAAGLGLVGTVVTLATGSASTAAGIGYWGAARAFYTRWIGRGQTIAFARDTRIVVETTPRRTSPITPATGPDRTR
ncbi:MAG: hypothetical protein M3O02_02090 [Acidobacteriota bacterium]|nr:hypothetical protein [Acidobacteriota bacterium]